MQLDSPILRGRLLSLVACCAPLLLLVAPLSVTAAEPGGEAIFKTKCAACHGGQGEGTKKHKERLEGNKSLAQLVELIGKTMPEDDPGTLSDSDAKMVAGFVYDAMYSPAARERNRPARSIWPG